MMLFFFGDCGSSALNWFFAAGDTHNVRTAAEIANRTSEAHSNCRIHSLFCVKYDVSELQRCKN